MRRHWPKLLFFALIVRPLVFLVMGLVIHQRERLPQHGPCILAANHNSHLDTVVLMSLFPLRMLSRVRPVAAADYFLKNRWIGWFALRVIGIVPIARGGSVSRESLFDGCREALARGDILILFPEGTRGEPEKMSALKKGIYYLASGVPGVPGVPVVPVFMHGLGKALPKGEALLVPFNAEVAIGEPLLMDDDATTSVDRLQASLLSLAGHCHLHAEHDAAALETRPL